MKSSTVSSGGMTFDVDSISRCFVKKLICRVLGHRVINRRFDEGRGRVLFCPCGEPLLRKDGAVVHVRHDLCCFLGGHSYTKTGERDGHCEYICNRCGHPLLFEQKTSPYAKRQYFHKGVRHRCNLVGHRVHIASERCGLTEYVCHCGHSFLLKAKEKTKVRHPLVCVLTGHRINLLTLRNGHLEFRCRDCGHPFCLAEGTDQPQSVLRSELSASVAVPRNVLSDFLKLIRFRFHLSFAGVVLGAALIARGLPIQWLLSLLVLYFSFNVLLYGGLYTINDILDAESDRQHPLKRNRPVQSGAISLGGAKLFAATFIAGGLVSGYLLFSATVFYIYLAVMALNLSYSVVARKIPWLEIVLNAAPHPLRFAMGAALAGGTAPGSLLMGIFFLAFGIAATRRLLEKDVHGWQARKVLESYSERDYFLMQMLPFCAVVLQMTFDTAIPNEFYICILAFYTVVVFGVHFLRPVRSFFVDLWTR